MTNIINFETQQLQRKTDGYVNATLLCKQAGKLFGDYQRLQSTQDFLAALSTSMGNPIDPSTSAKSSIKSSVVGIPTTSPQICGDQLVQIINTGDNANRGTWIHPQVAINLGQWLSPKFAVAVSKLVLDWMQGKTQKHEVAAPTPQGQWKYHNITKIRKELMGCKVEKLPLSSYDHAKHLVDKYMCLKYVHNHICINPIFRKDYKAVGANGRPPVAKLDIEFSFDNPYEVESFTKNGTTFYSLLGFGEESAMQQSGVFYHVARLPQEMKVSLHPGLHFELVYTIAEVQEMFGEYPKIYLTDNGVDSLMFALKSQQKGAVAQEARLLMVGNG